MSNILTNFFKNYLILICTFKNKRSKLEGLSPLFFMNDKKTIIALLNEFADPKKMASFFVDNATPDFLFIRPSGNPIDAKGFEQMITGDIVQEKAEITKIHRFEFLSENIVMCIFTLGSKFTIKGQLMMTYQQLRQFLKK